MPRNGGELNSLLKVEDLDWQEQSNDSTFSVVFPNKQSMHICLNSGGMNLPISKCKATSVESVLHVVVCCSLLCTLVKFWGIANSLKRT